jgi:four helix bundle protein
VGSIASYRDLLVWRKAVDLAIECYRVTRHFPASETYGLASQLRRSAVSVAANIAEGHGGKHLGSYLRHLAFAHGSLMEVETHLIIAARLSYLDSAQTLLSATAEIGRMLNGLRTQLSARRAPDT